MDWTQTDPYGYNEWYSPADTYDWGGFGGGGDFSWDPSQFDYMSGESAGYAPAGDFNSGGLDETYPNLMNIAQSGDQNMTMAPAQQGMSTAPMGMGGQSARSEAPVGGRDEDSGKPKSWLDENLDKYGTARNVGLLTAGVGLAGAVAPMFRTSPSETAAKAAQQRDQSIRNSQTYRTAEQNLQTAQSGVQNDPYIQSQLNQARASFDKRMTMQMGPGWASTSAGAAARENLEKQLLAQAVQQRNSTLGTYANVLGGLRGDSTNAFNQYINATNSQQAGFNQQNQALGGLGRLVIPGAIMAASNQWDPGRVYGRNDRRNSVVP